MNFLKGYFEPQPSMRSISELLARIRMNSVTAAR